MQAEAFIEEQEGPSQANQQREQVQGSNLQPQQQQSAIARFFGPFKTREFWFGLFAAIFQQAISAGLRALGGVLVHYGDKTFNKSIDSIAGRANTAGGQEAAQRAFSGQAFAPMPTYDDHFRPNRYNSESSSGNRFPGFAR